MARRTAQSSLTPALDITAGLQKFGLSKYVALFERLEIGKPMMELCEQHAGIWDELFADPAGLGMVEQGDRARLVGQLGAILQYCAAVQAEEAASVSLANRYLQPAPPPFQPSPQLPPTPVLPHQPPAAHGQFSTPMAQPPPIAAKPQQLSAMPPAQQLPSLPQKPPAQQLSAPPPSLPQKPPPGQLSTPAEWFNLRTGGLVFYGALLTILPVGALIIRRNKLPFFKIMDITAAAAPSAAPFLLLRQAVDAAGARLDVLYLPAR